MKWIFTGLFLMNILGFLIDFTWLKSGNQDGYFSYGIRLLNGFPYWIFATLLYLFVCGSASMILATARFRIRSDGGGLDGRVALPPMSLLGLLSMLVPVLIMMFFIARTLNI